MQKPHSGRPDRSESGRPLSQDSSHRSGSASPTIDSASMRQLDDIDEGYGHSRSNTEASNIGPIDESVQEPVAVAESPIRTIASNARVSAVNPGLPTVSRSNGSRADEEDGFVSASASISSAEDSTEVEDEVESSDSERAQPPMPSPLPYRNEAVPPRQSSLNAVPSVSSLAKGRASPASQEGRSTPTRPVKALARKQF